MPEFFESTGVGGAGSGTDNTIVRWDGTASIQASGCTIDDSDNMIVAGNLTVNGTTTTINTETLDVEDKNISVNLGSTTALSTGAGINILGDSDAVVGYIKQSDSDNSVWQMKAAGNAGVLTLDINATETITVGGSLNITADSTISGSNSGDQVLFQTIAGDTGSATANSTTDTFTIAGGTNVTTSVSGDTITVNSSGIGGSTGAADNRVLRSNGVGGSTAQASAVTIDDSGNISGVGTVDGRDLATDGSKLDGIEALADVTDETNVTSALSGATITAATVAGSDKILGQDTSDSSILKTFTAQSIADLKADQNVFGTVASDSGSAVADGTADTLTITGGTLTSTAVSGDDTLTINVAADLNDLSDVTITAVAHNDVIMWDTVSGSWVNDSIAGGGASDPAYVDVAAATDVSLTVSTHSGNTLLFAADNTTLGRSVTVPLASSENFSDDASVFGEKEEGVSAKWLLPTSGVTLTTTQGYGIVDGVFHLKNESGDIWHASGNLRRICGGYEIVASADVTTSTSRNVACEVIDTDLAVVAYKDLADTDGKFVAISSIGQNETPSLSSITTFASNNQFGTNLSRLDSTTCLVSYRDADNSNRGAIYVLRTLTGTPTVSAQALYSTAAANRPSVVGLNATTGIAFWNESSVGYYSLLTSLTGTPAAAARVSIGGNYDYISALKLDFDRVLIAYRDGGDSGKGKVRIISGIQSTVDTGTAVEIDDADCYFSIRSVAPTANPDIACIAYATGSALGDLYYVYVSGLLSGNLKPMIEPTDTGISVNINHATDNGGLNILPDPDNLDVLVIYASGNSSTARRIIFNPATDNPTISTSRTVSHFSGGDNIEIRPLGDGRFFSAYRDDDDSDKTKYNIMV